MNEMLTRHGGAQLQSEHLRGKGKRIRNSRTDGMQQTLEGDGERGERKWEKRGGRGGQRRGVRETDR